MLDTIQTMLQMETTSTAEYSMAEWKKICDKAMAKWRPYAKKSAADLGIDELRYIGYGSIIHKAVDPNQREVASVDTLETEDLGLVMEDVMARFRALTQDEDKVQRLTNLLVQSTTEIQHYRAALISAFGHSDVRGDYRLTIVKAAQDKNFDSTIVETKFKLKAEKFVELATMSPLRLLQLVTTFICSKSYRDDADFWPALTTFKDLTLQKEDSLDRRQLEIFKLLSVVSLCPRCFADDTKQVWRKTRSADEPFQFLVVCMKCHASTVIE